MDKLKQMGNVTGTANISQFSSPAENSTSPDYIYVNIINEFLTYIH